jgi:flagellar assembly factor FliW
MTKVFSQYFGAFDLADREVFRFPNGLPGFEDQFQFAAHSIPGQEPILYLQSVTRPELCLITVPARTFDPSYRPDLSPEDRETLHLNSSQDAQVGSSLACQVIVTVNESRQPTVNLAAPLVINLANRIGIQIFQSGAAYSFRHPLVEMPQPAPC